MVLLFLIYAYVAPGDVALKANWQHFFKWTLSLQGLFYFSLGIWFREHANLREFFFQRMNRGWFVLILCLAVALLCVRVFLLNDVSHRYFPISPIILVLFFVGLLGVLPSVALPKWLIGMSFPIYLLHVFVRLLPWSFIPKDRTIYFFLTWIVVVGLCMAVTFVLRRYFPKTSGVLFGGR